MYLFDLNMSNIKLEALAQEFSKRKVFLKILQNSLENKQECRSLFYNEGAGCMDKVKLSRLHFYPAQVFSSEICEIFKNTFENTNISVEYLRNR